MRRKILLALLTALCCLLPPGRGLRRHNTPRRARAAITSCPDSYPRASVRTYSVHNFSEEEEDDGVGYVLVVRDVVAVEVLVSSDPRVWQYAGAIFRTREVPCWADPECGDWDGGEDMYGDGWRPSRRATYRAVPLTGANRFCASLDAAIEAIVEER